MKTSVKQRGIERARAQQRFIEAFYFKVTGEDMPLYDAGHSFVAHLETAATKSTAAATASASATAATVSEANRWTGTRFEAPATSQRRE